MRSSKRFSGRTALAAFTWVLVLCAAADGAEFAGGTGEPNDPYQIATAEQLLSLDSAPELTGSHFVLAASIDMSGVILTQPAIRSVDGSFDGNGYVIRNLRIESEGGGALFDLISGEVRNLGVINVQIVGGFGSAALVCTNYGRVVNCYSTGAVIGTLGPAAGGLVGTNAGTITDSHSTASAIGGRNVGGLAGMNMGRVSSCYATGEVTGSTGIGGLVGYSFGEITESYSLATVSGQDWYVGGLVGFNAGSISSCYTGVTVAGQRWYVGGLVGGNRGSIASCYSTGSVTGVAYVGGLTGDSSDDITASYSVATVAGSGRYVGGLVGKLGSGKSAEDLITGGYFLDPDDGGGPDNEIGIPLTKAQMLRQTSFAGFDFWGTVEDGDRDLWFMPKTAYPVLAWQAGVTGLQPIPDVMGMSVDEAVAALEAAGFVAGEIRYDFDRTIPAGDVIHADPYWIATPGTTIDLVVSANGEYDWADNPGDGTVGSPYQIATAGRLESLGDHPELWSKCFVLTADVDMIGRTYQTALMAPDTDMTKSGFQGTPFSGTFDGQDHTIANLTISDDHLPNYVGLFGMIDASGRVSNLNLEEARVESRYSSMATYVGALAGQNAGTVIECSATGILSAHPSGDGLVGVNSGSMVDCRADVAML